MSNGEIEDQDGLGISNLEMRRNFATDLKIKVGRLIDYCHQNSSIIISERINGEIVVHSPKKKFFDI